MSVVTRHMVVVQTTEVDVTIDTSKVNDEFMKEFAGCIADFDLNDHFHHLAQLTARSIINEYNPAQFVEGYGPLDKVGIAISIKDEYITSE